MTLLDREWQPATSLPSEILELAHRRPEWHADALCREHPEVSFFPERGQPSAPALAVCAGCLALDDCRAWAIGQGADLHGIFGGTTGPMRAGLRKG